MPSITIPIQVQNVPEADRGKTKVRVALKTAKAIHSEVVSVSTGAAEARFEIEEPGQVSVAVGPASTDAADLFHKSTPTTTISARTLAANPVYKAPAIIITEPIWRLWLIWCRTFTISGYVIGQDGNPVPSASVTAFDVDWFWWWSSKSQVGPTVLTDPTGHFSITFEWCCGWLPWYWWELRDWRLDPILVDKISPVLAMNPQLRISAPTVRPELGFVALNPQPLPPGEFRPQVAFNPQPDPPGRANGRLSASAVALNPSTLPALRSKLQAVLPSVPEFERFCLWPWCDWWPWLDCDPDIIFQVTQSCGGLSKVIVEESIWQARIDIPTSLNVSLVANSDACTIPGTGGQPEGDCFLFTAACDVPAESIGITCDTTLPARPGALAGFANPGSEDRPFTGEVFISGQFGTSAQADYYELTYRALQPCPSNAVTPAFVPVPPASLSTFQRVYFDATKAYPNQWVNPLFAPTPMPVQGGGTATVYESRQYYEVTNAADWGNVMSGRSWTSNVDGIASLESTGYFTDGQYEFQVVGYTDNGDGTVTRVGPLAGCGLAGPGGLNDNNDFALTFANPVASQTIPSAAITGLIFTVSGVDQALPPCGILTVPPGGTLDALKIDFTASDGEGFLDLYDLTLQWSTNSPIGLSGSTAAVTPGAFIGPTYADAVVQGAARPNWYGGRYEMTVGSLGTLGLVSCAYELTLNVYKRNIVDCHTDDDYWLQAFYSFTILFQ